MRSCLLISVIVILTSNVVAGTVTIDFEGQPDGAAAAAVYAASGVEFSSGIIALSGAFGGTLNEVDFPPREPGQAVFLNESDITSLTFSTPITAFSAYFTYGGPLSLEFFGPGNTSITTLTTSFPTNIGSAGDIGSVPNELISVTTLGNAVRLDISAANIDFTLDDLSFVTSDTSAVPEPATIWLAVVSLAFGAAVRFSRSE